MAHGAFKTGDKIHWARIRKKRAKSQKSGKRKEKKEEKTDSKRGTNAQFQKAGSGRWKGGQ